MFGLKTKFSSPEASPGTHPLPSPAEVGLALTPDPGGFLSQAQSDSRQFGDPVQKKKRSNQV